ncbi:acylphosphatase [Pectinatus sottacetonis]|uniref:acylphosphatase n=1 Tax=Pectinatus sottacetonis TaxID=1002795 RepID=UPI0018C7AD9C|nr:acylphosphatase [Pectinatus sottacetonis]
MNRYFATACGRVQGVGFRYFVQTTAKKYGLTGWVKNMDDGTVTIEVQGEQTEIDKLFAAVKKGNMFIKVDELAIKPMNTVHETSSFTIKY